jgi:cyanophycin synthetase
MYWLRKRLLKYRWRRIEAAWRRGERLTLPLSIPSAFITGSVGKTTTCRMVEHILASSGLRVAVATTQGTFVGGEPRRVGDSSSCRFASRLLLDRGVQAGVFELARGGLLREGIAFDGCDVGAVLNVFDNHLGLGGVETREQMAGVKAEVVRAARRMAVLNADDPLCLAMRAQVIAVETCLVSMTADRPELLAHLEAGGVGAFLDVTSGKACLVRGGEPICSVPVEEIPATLGGRFPPAIGNVLFAMAIAHGMGVDARTIETAIRTFVSDERSNPDRMNFYEDLPYRLLMTTCDGREAMRELALLAGRIDVPGRKLLLVYSMGNRADAYIRGMSGVCAGAFDEYICTDAPSLRGRVPMETARLLAQGLIEEGVAEERITVAADHDDALRAAFGRVREGDLLVVQSFYSQRARELGLI